MKITNLPSRHTRRGFQNPPKTKINSADFNHGGERLCKMICYVKVSSNLIDRENFGAKLKNQTVKRLEITESICCFYGCLSITHKNNIIAQFSLGILQI